MLNCLFFRIFSSVRMKWVWASARYLAFGRTPGRRRLAKCDAGSSLWGRIFPRCGGDSLRCSGTRPHVGATWGFAALLRTHRRLGTKPHTAATRASRRGAGVRHTRRVDRVDFYTVGRSAPSTLFRQIRRSPLLFRNETKMPFFLRASTLFRI